MDCPGATTLYTGLTAGVYYDESGGGSNYLCYPVHPTYNFPSDLNVHFTRSDSFLSGTKYQHPIVGVHGATVPCASCYASTRSAQLMIPGKTSCPYNWNVEYYGYLMSDGHWSDRSRNEFICVDKSQQSLTAEINNQGALLYHVRVRCSAHGLACATDRYPYALPCVVCTR